MRPTIDAKSRNLGSTLFPYLVSATLRLGAALLDLVLVAAVGAVLLAVADPRVVDAVELVQALELGRRARQGGSIGGGGYVVG